MRLIDADALIEKCGEWYTEEGSEEGFIGTLKQLLDEQTTIEPKQEWIPCSERLPEYRKLVLVTTRDLRVKPAYLDSIQDDGADDLWSIPLDDADCALWNIVAWMPLPKPYKEGIDNEV